MLLLPYDLLSGTYLKPHLTLCETDKSKICQLDTTSMKGTFKFNSYDELSFTVGRTYTNMNTGETQVNPFYDKIEGLRLVYLDGFGYFEIQEPEISSDGIKEVKNVTAYGYEYTLAQKYLEGFKVNTGEVDSMEVVNATGNTIVPIVFYRPEKPELSLLHLVLEKIYGWSIGHVDSSLATMSRTFDVSRVSVYDFLVQDLCESFNCFIVFDTINNTINFYAESLVSKFIADGMTQSFIITPSPYKDIGSVSIDGYKVSPSSYTYDPNTGVLTFLYITPADRSFIEVTDGAQAQWITDVYVTFDNLAQNITINYSADDIKTVLTIKGADDLDIREVNMGLPYLTDVSYYYSLDWMGQDLYDAYTKYLQNYNTYQIEYQELSEKMLGVQNKITHEKQRLSLVYEEAPDVDETTVGTYFIRGGTEPNFYYTQVSLPEEYNANVVYYKLPSVSLNETIVHNLYEALRVYFDSKDQKDVSAIEALYNQEGQKNPFGFMTNYTIEQLVDELKSATTLDQKDSAILIFLDEMWDQVGLTPLEQIYYKQYKIIQDTNIEAGWDDESNVNYWNYYPVTLILESLDTEISQRKEIIEKLEAEYNALQAQSNEIMQNVMVDVAFKKFFKEQGLSDKDAETKTMKALIRLSAFLREDEYTDSNFAQTDTDTIATLMQTKKELMESGRIELSKLCEPKLSFSMDIANIYAIPGFKAITQQFQLGNLINVELRKDYIKRARLLQVDINFDDFSDFSCEFGELTNIKTPSSIHADLLSTALSAGKSVASNSSYWSQGADMVTSLALQIQQGLLDASTVIKAIDGNQGVSIDRFGIK